MKMNVMNPALHLKHVTHSLRKVQWKISTKYRSALLCSAGSEALRLLQKQKYSVACRRLELERPVQTRRDERERRGKQITIPFHIPLPFPYAVRRASETPPSGIGIGNIIYLPRIFIQYT